MPLPIQIMLIAWGIVGAWVAGVILTQRKYHPKSLFTLFFAEMWERFSFYGMRALLVLFMVQVLFKFMNDPTAIDARAYGVYGAYGALVYGTPVLGGLLADRLIGFRKAIIFGGILMALGHITLSVGDALHLTEMINLENSATFFFYPGLALLIVGNGYFKPNISSLLGRLYEEGDPRRDSGFTLFYMGINVGAFLAPLTCGAIGEIYGWHWGFGLAGVGMIIGLIMFYLGRNDLGEHGFAPDPAYLKKPVVGPINRWIMVIVGSILSIPIFSILVNQNDMLDVVLPILGAVILGYLLYDAIVVEGKVPGQRLGVILILALFHMLFWAFFEQAGSSINLFTERNVDRVLFGNELPTSIFQSVNPGFIILLAPLFANIWVWLSKVRSDPYTPAKFGWGLVQLGIGFGMFVIGARFFATDDALVPLVFLVLGYLFHTTGELCLSPVGLSMVTKLSPAKIVGFVMGAWFLSISFAHYLAGGIAQLTAVDKTPGLDGEQASPGAFAKTRDFITEGQFNSLSEDVLSRWDSLAAYISVFEPLAYTAIGGGVLMFLLVPLIKRMMHGVH